MERQGSTTVSSPSGPTTWSLPVGALVPMPTLPPTTASPVTVAPPAT